MLMMEVEALSYTQKDQESNTKRDACTTCKEMEGVEMESLDEDIARLRSIRNEA